MDSNSSVKAIELKPHGHVWIIQNFRIHSHCQDGKIRSRTITEANIDKKADEDGIIAAVEQLIFTVTSYIKSA